MSPSFRSGWLFPLWIAHGHRLLSLCRVSGFIPAESSRRLKQFASMFTSIFKKSAFQSDAVKRKLIERSSSGKVRASSKPLAIDHQRYEPKNQIPSSREFGETSAKLKRTSNFVQGIYSDIRSSANIDEGALTEASSILTDAVVKMPAASFRFLSVL